MSEEERKKPEEEESNGQISRREFLRDAGLVVGGATVSSMALLSACKGSTSTETVTQAVTKTVTGASGGTQTVTVTGSTPAAATKTVTVTTTAPGVTVTATAPAAASSTIKLTINKGKYEVPVEPHWSLHHLLHDRLGWTGVKDMCNGYGACGACTVIVDGRPVLSCLTLAGDCDGKTIETPEGASVSNTKLLDAYVLNYCMQCGYCTPGLFVTAKALLDRIPKPTEADIREAMGGNICR
jgi:aerobic-type carbon monoxide dehydrogenase small subunit (CoxS/CutS family)